MTALSFADFGAGDSFSFNHTLYGGGLPGIGESHSPEVTLGVNFESHLSSHSEGGDGWFVYHTDTGNLHWDQTAAVPTVQHPFPHQPTISR